MTPRPIFIHGAGGGVASWEHQEPAFEGCCALALPGHPAGSALASVGGYAEWVAHVLPEIPAPRVLVGHSLGGAIALEVATIAPELVAGLVIVSSGPRLKVPQSAIDLAGTDVAAEAERLVRKGWPNADAATIAREAAAIAANGSETLVRDYRACLDFDLTARLDEIGAPVLVINGDGDEMTPPFLSAELASGLPVATLVTIPTAGHWVMKEEPTRVNLLIAAFLARLETRGG